MSPPIQRPTPAQIAAADPAVSAWVGANAGSGKTRVLTQRVARLLLAGAAPARILCLTYTKAAAAEMQSRLFATLGDWAMAPDTWLAEQLGALAGQPPVTDPAQLAAARRLFARALETPGGLKIQTIHAFCDALLRRFPLEAGVSPRFAVLGDRDIAQLRARLRLDLAARAESGADPAFDQLAEVLNEDAIDQVTAAAFRLRQAFPGDPVGPRLVAHFGPVAGQTPDQMAREALARFDWDRMAPLIASLAAGGVGDRKLAEALVLARQHGDPVASLHRMITALLTKEQQPRKNLPTKAVVAANPNAATWVAKLQERATLWSDQFAAIRSAGRAARLDGFATAALGGYAAAKRARALLDFDDLVAGAGQLLTGSDMAQWVLWKLDQGLDHILVDEAQDTAPAQWAVIEAIAREFHAGEGARDTHRTLFVVGDEKQSIYSFQGAEPRAFGRTRDALAARLDALGQRLERPDLITSFRSAPGILAFVDAVFDGPAALGLTVAGDPVRHVAHRAGDGARVDLWAVVPGESADPDPDWGRAMRPVDAASPGAAKDRLARLLAVEIARMIAQDHRPSRGGQPGARVRPGDILVLVTKRDALARGLIRQLKAQGVPVAGADRLTLAQEIAVQDLIALMTVAICPGDDLSLAALLRSPLCAVDEAGLFDLAQGRSGSLWGAVQARGGPDAAMLADMAAQADYLRPYEFLERALIRHDARRRLIARLGVEAEDAIDELLAEALRFEAGETPSLAGFIAWIGTGDIQVKREMEAGGDAVRVMTIHGAKGLEAPIVILPDTMGTRAGGPQGLGPVPVGGGNLPPLVLWPGRREDDDRLTARERDEAETRAQDERRRLFYVALTRAEDWLILCGAGDPAKTVGTWYGLAAAAMDRLGAEPLPGPAGELRRLASGPDLPPGPDSAAAPLVVAPTLPPWACPAPPEARVVIATPSRLGAHDAGSGLGLGRGQAMLRGTAVHLILERLGGAARDSGRAAALLAAQLPELDAALAAEAMAEALAVLAAPWAAPLFGPDSLAEVEVVLNLPGFGAMTGRIDRLVPQARGPLILDFKTDAIPAATPDQVPPAYLAQLGAYCAGLAGLGLGTPQAAIIWTRGPVLMPLPPAALAAALAESLARGDLGAIPGA